MTDPRTQRGGTLLGFVLGLVIGLAVALGVAIYVTKVPTPFSNKNQTRSPEQDAVESQKNKDWNPNSPLQPKAPASAPEPADGASASVPAPGQAPVENARPEVKPAVQADPLGDLAKSKAGLSTSATQGSGGEPFSYYVQVGAYRSVGEAEAQKARMALMGLDARVSEREQAGRTVYRVRLGPFEDKANAERVHAKLDSAQVESTIVRTQR